MRPDSNDSYASHRPSGEKLAPSPQVRLAKSGRGGADASGGIRKRFPVAPDPSAKTSVDPSGDTASGRWTSSLRDSRFSSSAPSARRDQRFHPRASRDDA